MWVKGREAKANSNDYDDGCESEEISLFLILLDSHFMFAYVAYVDVACLHANERKIAKENCDLSFERKCARLEVLRESDERWTKLLIIK